MYSNNWQKVNTKPYTIVQNKPYHATLVFSAKIALWATVKVTPDDNKIIVFKKEEQG